MDSTADKNREPESNRLALRFKEDILQRSQEVTKPTERLEQKEKGPRTVRDPTTGLDVTISDANPEDYHTDKLAHVHPDDPSPGPATHPAGGNDVSHPSKTAPQPAMPGNVLIHMFPAAPDESLKPLVTSLDRIMMSIVGGCFIIWCFVSFGAGWLHFLLRSSMIGAFAVVVTTMVSVLQRGLEKNMERVRADMARKRGESFMTTPESVEWLNSFLKCAWGLANPDMFIPIADQIEDIMQQSLPGFVDAVRISDIGQGTNPIRIISMRALPDQPGDKTYPRKDWNGFEKTGDTANQLESDANPDIEQSGGYVNYEVAFSYQALPGHGQKLRNQNMHLMLEFFLGMYDWLHIPIPIWVVVEGICGTVRLRIQFIPEAPFVRNLTFTLMGVPAIEVSVVPLTTHLPNLLDLPFVSRFVKQAITAGTADITAPKSMTLNIQDMLGAAAIGDTQAVGVFVITVHHAEGLAARDHNGQSDPYIVLSYAKFGKPLYSTRVILCDLNPTFEETAMIILKKDEVQVEEDVSAMLWDSDKRSADDLLGRVQIPVKQLMQRPNEMIERVDSLVGFEDASPMAGKLYWSVGYFEKCSLNVDLERIPDSGHPVPSSPESDVKEKNASHPRTDKKPKQRLPEPGPDVQRTPPDPEWPSGILSVVMHQINNLERQNLKGTMGAEREGQAGQDTDQPSEQSSNLPSAYCEIIVNDDLIYKTRVKQYSAMPFFETGTEVFVRDWRSAVVRVVVRDARLREHDPILGIVDLPLAKVLSDGSEVTRLFPLQEGIGFGRANISILFKSIKLRLPRPQLGWDTATVEINNDPIRLSVDPEHKAKIAWAAKGTTLLASTTDSTETLSKSDAVVDENGHVSWRFDLLRLPVYERYSSSLYFEFGTGAMLDRKVHAIAVLWLQDIVDNEESVVNVPVIMGKNLSQLRQNAITEFTAKTHDFEIVGQLRVAVKIDPGLDMDHEKKAKTESRRHAFETYDHIEGEALVTEKLALVADEEGSHKQERKEMKAAHERQNENRQRGIAGYKPYRTFKWMQQGIKSRVKPSKPAKREPAVNTEV